MIKAGKKNVLFTRFMGSIRSWRPDAECFSRQLDLKGISCLGGHPRDPEGQGKYVAHVPLLSVPPPTLDITNQSRSFPTEARESLAVLQAWCSRRLLPTMWSLHTGQNHLLAIPALGVMVLGVMREF